MNRSTLLGSFAMLLAVLPAGCGDAGDARRASDFTASDLTLDQVYDGMENAISRPDRVIHVSLVVETASLNGTQMPSPTDLDAEDYGDQLWIDAGRGVVRIERRTRDEGESTDRVSKSILRKDATFKVDDKGISTGGATTERLTCRGSDSWVIAQLMRCTNALEESTTVVESGQYDGRDAIALFTTGKLPSHDWTSNFEQRLYLDASSYLPLAVEHHSTVGGDGGDLNYQVSSRYDLKFVERGSLPDDFFDPASIDYVYQSPVPIENLQPEIEGIVVYWLGEEFDAGRGQPLSLLRAKNHLGERAAGPLMSLSYGIEDDPDGYRGFGVEQYPADREDLLQPEIDEYWSGPNVTRTEMLVGDSRVILFQNSTRYGDLYRAQIYCATTIVVVQDYLGAPPYTGRDGIMRAVSELKPF